MKNEIVLFTDGDVNIEVQINPEQETVWLTQKQMEVKPDTILKKPMVQTDNSQSHWFSLSKYILWFFYNFYFTFSNLLFASRQTLSPSLMLHS